MTRRYFEDLVLDQLAISSPRVVDEENMIRFAKEYDPQYFHADKDAAKHSRFGSVIASGQYTMVLWRQLDHEIAHDIAWICGIAWDEVRWPLAVRAGDALRATSRCIEKRRSENDATRGIVKYEYRLLNQNDQVVFRCVSTNLVETRSSSGDA